MEVLKKAIHNADDLLKHDERLDAEVCGFALFDSGSTRYAKKGAHDPTPTPYFVLDDLFRHFDFRQDSHLLDAGCGKGRVLAFYQRKGFPGRATGVELDPDLASLARSWTGRYSNLDVIQADVLSLDLGKYTHFYLFNPFDTNVLLKFLPAVEEQVRQPITLVHMSDNGETFFYVGRPGWSQVDQGDFQMFRTDQGKNIQIYNHPQHYSVWKFDPVALQG